MNTEKKYLSNIRTNLSKLSDGELVEQTKQLAREDKWFLIDGGYLRIKTKKQQMIPLVPNRIQREIKRKIDECLVKKKKVRLLILKGRQFGCSTFIQSLFYSIVSQKQNVTGLTVAHVLDAANYLFEMEKIFQNKMEQEYPELTPQTRKSNEKKLEFKDIYSQIFVDAVNDMKTGRSFTYHIVHVSEAAYIDHLNNVLMGLMQSVPQEDDSMIILETTANGFNDFYNLWTKAEAKENDWDILFLPWYWHDEYIRVVGDREGFEKSLTAEEQQLRERYKLTIDQLNWRRYTIQNNCGGDIHKFMQEYPCNAEEAFVGSKSSIFLPQALEYYYKRITNDCIVSGNLVDKGYRIEFVGQEKGWVQIFKHPEKDKQYIIGADSGAGLEDGDYSAGVVYLPNREEIVAIIHGKIPPDIFAEELNKLGRYYNWALLAPEIDNPGIATVIKLQDLGYRNLIRRIQISAGIMEEAESKYGWKTTKQLKFKMVTDLQEKVHKYILKIPFKQIVNEMNTYVLEDGKYQAQNNCYDDLVMALGIAVTIYSQYPNYYSLVDGYDELVRLRQRKKSLMGKEGKNSKTGY